MMHLVQIYLSDSSRAFNVDTLQVRGTSFGPLAMHQLRLLRERVVVCVVRRFLPSIYPSIPLLDGLERALFIVTGR